MILRRIADAVKKQDWFVVFIELMIVVVGIYLGLQVDAWNQDRIAKKTTETYYARLIEDLGSEKEARLVRVAYFGRAMGHGQSALEALNNIDAQLGNQFIIDIYQASQSWGYSPQRSTYDELLAVGIAEAIPDTDLRKRLANYYNNLGNSATTLNERVPYRDNIRSVLPAEVQITINDVCGDRFVFRDDSLVTILLSEDCKLELDPALIESSLLALQGYDNLKADLNRRIGDLNTKLGTLRAHIPPTEDLILYLQENAP